MLAQRVFYYKDAQQHCFTVPSHFLPAQEISQSAILLVRFLFDNTCCRSACESTGSLSVFSPRKRHRSMQRIVKKHDQGAQVRYSNEFDVAHLKERFSCKLREGRPSPGEQVLAVEARRS
jgi:hypothetical protein